MLIRVFNGLINGLGFFKMHVLRSKNDHLEQAMQAIMSSGGKQYRVQAGQVIRLEKLAVSEGEAVHFDQVLLLSDGQKVQVGAPHVAGAKVSAKVLAQGREKKVKIIKFKRRKHHMKQMGHRQDYTEVQITGIEAG